MRVFFYQKPHYRDSQQLPVDAVDKAIPDLRHFYFMGASAPAETTVQRLFLSFESLKERCHQK